MGILAGMARAEWEDRTHRARPWRGSMRRARETRPKSVELDG